MERPSHELITVFIEAQPVINATASSIVAQYRAIIVPRVVRNNEAT
jgi:hypothetical protein